MIIGTSYFPTIAKAERYDKPYQYGDVKEAVQRKLAYGEIHIGKPPLNPGDTLLLIDAGTRYAIITAKEDKGAHSK